MITLSQRLTALRSEKGVSAPELASALGFAKTAIEKFETGKLTPSKAQQEKLASYFGVTVAYLRGETGDRSNESGWVGGEVSAEPIEEPARQTVRPQRQAPEERRVVASTEKAGDDSAFFGMLLQSDAFRKAVLDVLRSPEGQTLLTMAARKEIQKK